MKKTGKTKKANTAGKATKAASAGKKGGDKCMKKYTEERPWGSFDEFCKNKQCTVKILSLKPNEELSLQYHYKRTEFWRIIEGEATVEIGGKKIKGNEGDEFFIPKEKKHRARAGEKPVKILEISFGDFDENDEVRVEDKYKRVTGTIY
jgi:mannose-6-phosphate isomerase-like protein (cupin superfamily)